MSIFGLLIRRMIPSTVPMSSDNDDVLHFLELFPLKRCVFLLTDEPKTRTLLPKDDDSVGCFEKKYLEISRK